MLQMETWKCENGSWGMEFDSGREAGWMSWVTGKQVQRLTHNYFELGMTPRLGFDGKDIDNVSNG